MSDCRFSLLYIYIIDTGLTPEIDIGCLQNLCLLLYVINIQHILVYEPLPIHVN